jgi:DNA-binding response OmpR family regulator
MERTVNMQLLNLRRKIEDDPRDPRYVLTVKGRGYKLADEL